MQEHSKTMPFQFRICAHAEHSMMAVKITENSHMFFSDKQFDECSRVETATMHREPTWASIGLDTWNEADENASIVPKTVNIDIPKAALDAISKSSGQLKTVDLSKNQVFTVDVDTDPDHEKFNREEQERWAGTETKFGGTVPSVEALEAGKSEKLSELEEFTKTLDEEGTPYKIIETSGHFETSTRYEVYAGGLVRLQEAFKAGGVEGEAFQEYLAEHFQNPAPSRLEMAM